MKYILATLAFLFATLASLPSYAINESPVTSPNQVTEQMVIKYTHAAEKVESISRNYESLRKDVSNEEEAKELMEKTRAEMIQAIESAGLSVENYNNIFRMAREDEALQKKITSMMRQ
ncbi:DUF4168 domain-containing protein [Salinivibrio proteolyticus]|uniref:DUF4168 domain-containing protein n=1 Tax=Salinivibrio proteolyticus TaxID=334715 RepID=UPI000988E175|nr:DUF4168 domain-containing protein [Salinivibrio proteolyticus]OOF28595.1 hypothetical protein BZJ20_15910 [Salinivibrio proteolyticus]